jgi:hypothetical protein
MVHRLLCLFSVVFILLVIASLAQGAPQCPPVISSLMPANAVKVTCQYNSAGIVGMGFGAADLPFDNICANQTTKFPGKITFDIKHYSGEGVQLFKMQIDSEEQQRADNKKAELEKKYGDIKKNAAKLDSIVPLKTEKVPGGSITYFGYSADCSEGVKRSKPSAFLHGVGHNEDTAIDIEVEGNISADAAKAAASEVLANFSKADFTKLDK